MVNSIGSGDNNKKDGKQHQSKHFSYQFNKQESNTNHSWKQFEKNDEKDYLKSSWNKNNFTNSSSSKNTWNQKQMSSKSKGFDIDNVWSIRNNVSVNTSNAPLPPTNSYYSRHQQEEGVVPTWKSKAKAGKLDQQIYSLNNKLPFQTDNETRQMSARTERANKYHNAYLKSNGLGKYSTPAHNYNQSSNDEDERDF